jgi:DNA helicase MCM9
MPSECKDYQEIRLQEHLNRLSVGTIPRSVTILLEDDLVDSCKAGDEATIR